MAIETLEQLTEVVDELLEMRIPEGVTASLSMHGLPTSLLEEWVDAYPGYVQSKRRTPEGGRVAVLNTTGLGRSIVLFERAPQVNPW